MAKKLFVETIIERMDGHILASEIHPATEEDIELARQLYEKGQCPHNIVYDEGGWMYDIRICATCEKGLGVI